MKKDRDETFFGKLKSRLGWRMYSAEIAVRKLLHIRQKPARKMNKRLKDGIFVYLMLLLPLLQFCIFYIGVNVNSIVMAFEEYDQLNNVYTFTGLSNFRRIWDFFGDEIFKYCLKNSLLGFFAIQLLSPVVLFFTFFIYKKFFGGEFFKVVLFLPTIISTIITVTVYKYFVELAIPSVFEKLFHKQIGGLLSTPSTSFGAVIFYYMWLSFGSLMLMYLGCMNGISESIVESAKLEGATDLQEFVYITFPMIWPTFATLFYTSVAGIFTNQLNLYTLWGTKAEGRLYTFGYYLYKGVAEARTAEYPYLSALGLLMTLIAAPLTFFAKWGMNKIGPKTE